MQTPVSTRILELLGADLPPTPDRDAFLKLLRFAQFAWNYAILPAESSEANAVTSEILRLPAQHRSEMMLMLGELSERKRRMFPDDSRIIVEVWIEDRKKELVVKASHYDYRQTKK
jgi:hypothetical protein